MKPNEANLTLRQRFELERQSTKSQSQPFVDIFLRKFVGHPVTVKFQGGDQITDVLAAMDKFTIKLGDNVVAFKHAVQSVRMEEPRTRAGKAESSSTPVA